MYFLTLLMVPLSLCALSVTTRQVPASATTTDIIVNVHLKNNEQVFQNTILCSINHPDLTVSQWKTDRDATNLYDKHRKTTTLGFDKDFTITTTITNTTELPITKAKLNITLKSSLDSYSHQTFVPIEFSGTDKETSAQESYTSSDDQESPTTGEYKQTKKSFITSITKLFDDQYIERLLKTTQSIPLKFLFALLLGILLSLTPCIYPMIPITVGVLQSQGSKSLAYNFFLSLAYTLGMSITFACMGLLAASTGEAFGQMLASPLFIVCIVSLLCYFAFSLFGLYNLYIPRFLQQKRSISNQGSVFSIFLFGLMSGSVASPCLSPGLALILSMVATMASKFLGFLLLFAFGIGISTPLLIIGTFSGSMKALPKAGMWMLEVQKIFGFMLFGMCFYYLNNILPWSITSVMLTLFVLSIGVFYLHSINKHDSTGWRIVKNIIGITSIALSVFLFIESIQELYYPKLNDTSESSWYTDYDKAVNDAKKEKKKLLVDFWSPQCSICKIIANKVLKNPAVIKTLEEHYIVVSVNGNDSHLEPYKSLNATYKVFGFPTILIVEPHHGKELRRWQGELEDVAISDVINELILHSKHT